MKKFLSVVVLTVLTTFLLSSCSKEDEFNAVAKITVKENGSLKSGVSVHMFDHRKGPGTSFFIPFFADKVVVTEADGIATFNLQEVFDLEVIDTQTTFYFAVFDLDDNVLGNTGLTIEKGQTKAA
ncbi:MAG: hypothetical protein KJ754_00130, partial [Bacteroidetes bacterium]|nr:hypothetical protein [Bacteroidota bacterium]